MSAQGVCSGSPTSPSSNNVNLAMGALKSSGFFAVKYRDRLDGTLNLEDIIGITSDCHGGDKGSREMFHSFLLERIGNMWTEKCANFPSSAEPFNNAQAAFSECNRLLTISCKGSKVDAMFALRKSARQKQLLYPVVIFELRSVGDYVEQIAFKLVAHLALVARCNWSKGRFFVDQCPSKVSGLSLPGFQNPGSVVKVVVEWDSAKYCYLVSYITCNVRSEDDLIALVSVVLDENQPVFDYWEEVWDNLPYDANDMYFPTVYSLSPFQLRELNSKLGGVEGSRLEQVRSNEGTVFQLSMPHCKNNAKTHLQVFVLIYCNSCNSSAVLGATGCRSRSSISCKF
eukprot:Rmarinus@m.2609